MTGFNQGWLNNSYGSQWTRNWDEDEARRLLRATANHGGGVLRMWLFEGHAFEGIIWDADPSKSADGYDGTRTRPTALTEEKRANLERFLTVAATEGVAVYLTLFDANVYNQGNPAIERRRAEWWNILNDDYDAGSAFCRHILEPILVLCRRHRSAVFAIDLMNELNALVRHHWFANGWTGARRFVSNWRNFIKARIPDVPVSVSFGHHDASSTLLAGLIPPTMVDFYDIHAYNDQGNIPAARRMTTFIRTCNKPVYLGEFGQRAAAFDDGLQTRVTKNFIANARRCGFAGAFAWRLSDIRPGYNAQARHSYEASGRWRPAMEAFRQASMTVR